MSRLLRTLALASSCLCLVLHAAPPATSSAPAVIPGVLTNPDPTKPPPFVEIPGQKRDSGSIDRATEAIPAALLARLKTAHAKWLVGRSDLYPKLRYAGGFPTLMLVAPADEPVAHQLVRFRAIVAACEYLVADDAFEHATITITQFDLKHPEATTVRNFTVHRSDFQAAVRKAGKLPALGAALGMAYRSNGSMQQICSDLGIN